MTMADEKIVKCLRPDCAREANIRGLCRTCYAVARAMVKSGAVTWENLEAEGKCLKSGSQGRAKGSGQIQKWLLGK